jgi:amino acid transporter
METTAVSPRTRRAASYAVETVLLIIVLAIAAVEVAGVHDLFQAVDPSDRCPRPQSTYDALGYMGIVALTATLAMAGTSLWRLARRRPSAVWAFVALIVSGTIFLVVAFIALAGTSC